MVIGRSHQPGKKEIRGGLCGGLHHLFECSFNLKNILSLVKRKLGKGAFPPA